MSNRWTWEESTPAGVVVCRWCGCLVQNAYTARHEETCEAPQ